MDLCYFKSKNGNFGDDLNPYIINQFLPDFESYRDEIIVFFIGTVLHESFEGIKRIKSFDKKKKIVLGSGIRFINRPIKIDKSWDIRFLRGPLSSLSLLGNKHTYITDPAYLIRELPIIKDVQINKKYKISLMPHFLSLDKIDWAELCNQYNVNFIDPTETNLEFVLSEINNSELLITEAMHGAIVADALRVPWKRFTYSSYLNESEMVSEFKWSDWLFSMNLTHSTNPLYYNKLLRELDKRVTLPSASFIRNKSIKDSFEGLLNQDGFQLSKEEVLNENMDKLLTEMLRFKSQLS